jgi:uncharacterized protein
MAKRVSLPLLRGPALSPLDASTLPVGVPWPAGVERVVRSPPRLEGRPFRASGYVIYADLPGGGEEVLLIHGYTGAYDKVSRSVATYLQSLAPSPPPRPLHGAWSQAPAARGAVRAPSQRTMERLKKRGYLTQMLPEEEEGFFTHLASTVHGRALRRAPTYILMPTYQCNLRCHYCFQDHLRTDPAYGHLLRSMDRDMVDRIWKGMDQIDAAHGVGSDPAIPRSIILFGGEPLLVENRPIVEHVLQRLRERGAFKLAATTNGTDLEAYADLLGPEALGHLQITIDGPPREHDKRRIYPDGSGSFERIAANVTLALERGASVSLRMNVDRGNIHLLPELAEELIRRGWTRAPRFSAYAAPVHGSGEDAGASATFDSWKLHRALARLAEDHPAVRQISTADDSMHDVARQVIEGTVDPLATFRSAFCGAHGSMYVIDAFGDIYACWEQTGDPNIRIGAVAGDGQVLMSREILERWRNRAVISNEVCRRCRYAAYCGGGCALMAEQHTGDMYTNYCDGFGKRFRASVAQAYLAFRSGARRKTATARLCDM